jgi:DNA-binding SARP family transcriptional activator
LYETIGDISGMSRSHHEIGFCLEKQGNLSGAEHHYKLALRQSSGNAYDFANTLNSLGVLLYFAGRYEEALKRFQESLDIARQVGAARRAAFAQASIADVYLDCGQYEQALKAYAASTQLAQEAGVRKLEIYNLVKTGEGYYQQGDLDQAFLLAEQAREIAAETGLVFEDGLACALQAKIYIRRAEYRASFGLFDQALAGLAGNDVLEQGRARLWWGYGLLLDLRPMAAFKQLQEAIKLAMGMGEMRHGLRPVVTETRQLLLHFLYRADTAAGLRESLSTLLRLSQEPLSTLKPGLQVFAFGSPLLIVSGMQRRFVQRGGIRKAPEFLLYLLIEGREVGCRWSEVSEAIWPDLEPDKASSLFHQTLRRLRDTIFESPDYIIRQDDYYRLNPDYLEWCDALTFDTLYERAARAAPEEALALQLELIDLYQGEFLAGFELGEWGTAYRASCEIRFLQMVKLASEQLLRAGLPQETLTIINKGLALDQFREDLHRAALNAYAQLGLYDRLTAHYDVLRATFEHELGAPPEPATQQLYAQLIGSK